MWFGTNTYTDIILTRMERKTHAVKEKEHCFIHMITSNYNDGFLTYNQSVINLRLFFWTDRFWVVALYMSISS